MGRVGAGWGWGQDQGCAASPTDYSRADYDQVLAPLAVGLWDAVTLAYGRADLVRVRVRVRVR